MSGACFEEPVLRESLSSITALEACGILEE